MPSDTGLISIRLTGNVVALNFRTDICPVFILLGQYFLQSLIYSLILVRANIRPPMPNDQPHTQKFKFMYLKDYEQRPEEGPAASSAPPPSLMQARQCSLPIAKFNIYFLITNL